MIEKQTWTTGDTETCLTAASEIPGSNPAAWVYHEIYGERLRTALRTAETVHIVTSVLIDAGFYTLSRTIKRVSAFRLSDTVGADDSGLQAESRPKSIGFI